MDINNRSLDLMTGKKGSGTVARQSPRDQTARMSERDLHVRKCEPPEIQKKYRFMFTGEKRLK